MRRSGFIRGGVVCFVFGWLVVFGHGETNSQTGGHPLRVLFIGNSYTWFNNLPHLVKELAVSAHEGRPLDTRMIVGGAYTLKRHWEEGAALKAIQQGGPWDYVVLQEHSCLGMGGAKADKDTLLIGGGVEPFHRYARMFDAAIKRAGARTIFFLTWAHKDFLGTQPMLTDAYVSIGRELHDKVAPVGIAWHDEMQLAKPMELYQPDMSHPSPNGSYLAACVIYMTLYEHSPVGLVGMIKADPTGIPTPDMATGAQLQDVNLSVEQARALQQVAVKAEADFEAVR